MYQKHHPVHKACGCNVNTSPPLPIRYTLCLHALERKQQAYGCPTVSHGRGYPVEVACPKCKDKKNATGNGHKKRQPPGSERFGTIVKAVWYTNRFTILDTPVAVKYAPAGMVHDLSPGRRVRSPLFDDEVDERRFLRQRDMFLKMISPDEWLKYMS
jgi:hypothetical protein